MKEKQNVDKKKTSIHTQYNSPIEVVNILKEKKQRESKWNNTVIYKYTRTLRKDSNERQDKDV